MITKTMRVKENSFRKLEDPFGTEKGWKYVFYVKIDDVPTGIPMATNPRDQKMNSNVAKAIIDSLTSNDGYFHLKNRGIVISAASVNYNNKTNEATIKFDDSEIHGNIDGGHTYKIVCDHQRENIDQYVQFEVMTGVEEIIEGLAEARNTSVQVDEKSMAELQQKFDPIKEALEGMQFYKRIAFKQNQSAKDETTDKNLKMIDAREIVAIINMFNIDKFGETNHPVQAYSSKAKMLELYLENYDSYNKFVNIIPDIFDLYEAIEVEFVEAYNDNNGRYGRKKYSGFKDGKIIAQSKFFSTDLKYKVPDGFMYPTLSAFRSLICYNENTEKYEWTNGINPFDIWSETKTELVNKIMNFASSIGDNPNTVGKDQNIWDLAYMTISKKKMRNEGFQ